jgi:hypothetical protein
VRTTLGSGTVIGGVSRGLGKLRVERRTASGAWAPAASVRQRDGLFRAVVRVKHPGLYRVAAPKYAAAVELRLGGVR